MILWLVFAFFMVPNGRAEESLMEPSSNCNPNSESLEDNYSAPPVRIPQTSFSCWGRYDGYYADVELDCVVFHYCQTWQFPTGVNETVKWDFFCPESTTFNQKLLACTRPTSAYECYDSPQYYWVNYNLYNPAPETNSRPKPVSIEGYAPSQQVDSLQQGAVTYPNQNAEYYPHEQGSSSGGNNEGYAPSYPSYSDFYGNNQMVSYDQSNPKPAEPYPTSAYIPEQYPGGNFSEPISGDSVNYDSSGAYYGAASSLPMEQNLTASIIPGVQNESFLLPPSESSQSAGQHPENLSHSSNASFSTEAPVQYSTPLNTHTDVKPEVPQEDLISIQFDVTFNFNPNGDKYPSGLNESVTGNSSSGHRDEPAEQNAQEPTQASATLNPQPSAAAFGVTGSVESFEPVATISGTTYSADETPLGSTQSDIVVFSTESYSGQETTDQYPTDLIQPSDTTQLNDTNEVNVPEETNANPAVDNNESTVSSEANASASAGSQPSLVAELVPSQKPESFEKPIEPIVTVPVVLTPFAEGIELISNSKIPPFESKHNETVDAHEFSDIVNFENDTVVSSQVNNSGSDSRPHPIDFSSFQGSGEPPEKANQDVDELVDQGSASAIKYFLIN